MRVKIVPCYWYIVILIIMSILTSKTVYFGIINRELYQYSFYVLVFAGMFLNFGRVKLTRRSVCLLGALVIAITFSTIIHLNDMSGTQFNSVLGSILPIIFVFLLSTYVSKETYVNIYLNFIAILCVISLPCFLIANISPEFAKTLCQPGYAWDVQYGYSPFYTWGWNGQIFSRNSGPFWEPGAFQAFIIIAVLMLLFQIDTMSAAKRKKLLTIFLVTLLTTQSTTAYILVGIIFTILFNDFVAIYAGSEKAGNISKNRKIWTILFTLIVIAVLVYIVSSGNISDKFSNTNTSSAMDRQNNLIGGAHLIAKGGLLGLGETATKSLWRSIIGVSENDSVGLFNMLYTYGILFGSVYLYGLFRGIKEFFEIRKIKYLYLISVIFIILHLTEGLWWLPTFVTILFFSNLNKKAL